MSTDAENSLIAQCMFHFQLSTLYKIIIFTDNQMAHIRPTCSIGHLKNNSFNIAFFKD